MGAPNATCAAGPRTCYATGQQPLGFLPEWNMTMIRHAFWAPVELAPPYEPSPNEKMHRLETKLILGRCIGTRLRVLEVGTFRGVTANNIARVIGPRSGIVHTVDVGSVPSTLPPAQAAEVLDPPDVGVAIEDANRRHVVQHIIEPEGLRRLLDEIGEGFDVVFIDGDHSYQAVERDFGVCRKWLKQGGVIFLHDVWWDASHPPVDGPLRLAQELGLVVLNYTHLAFFSAPAQQDDAD